MLDKCTVDPKKETVIPENTPEETCLNKTHSGVPERCTEPLEASDVEGNPPGPDRTTGNLFHT